MQRTLFDAMPGMESPPRVRRSDPETSRQADVQIREKLGQWQQIALDYVRRYQGKTARELDELYRGNTGKIQDRPIGKRLNELVRSGYVRAGSVRECTVTGKNAQTYWA